MNDEFGGTLVDETDDFGGTLVQDHNQDEFGGTLVDAAPPEPVYGDESGIPTNWTERQRKRVDLLSQLAGERATGDELSAKADDLARQERSIGFFADPLGNAINIPGRVMARIGGVSDTYKDVIGEDGQIISTSVPADATGAVAGVGRVGANLLNSMFNTKTLSQLPAAAGGAAGQAIMAVPMAKDLPEQISHASEVIQNPESTSADVVEAIGNPLATGAMLGGLAAHGQVKVPVPEKPLLSPDVQAADLGARNRLATGTLRPQEIQAWDAPRPEPPAEFFQAGEVPFNRMQRFSGPLPPAEILPQMGRLGPVEILDEARTKQELSGGGKVSFAADAPTLNREAIPVQTIQAIGDAEAIGLTNSAEAATKAALKDRPVTAEPAPVEPAPVEPAPMAETPAPAEPHPFEAVKSTEQAWDYGAQRRTPADIAGMEQMQADLTEQVNAIKADPNLTPMQKLTQRADIASGPLHFIKESISAAKGETDRPAMTAYLEKNGIKSEPVVDQPVNNPPAAEPSVPQVTGKKPLPPGTKFTVQDSITVGDETAPRHVQVDFVENGENTRSSNPDTLKAEGYDVPDTSTLKQGQHTLEDVTAQKPTYSRSAKFIADKLREQLKTPETGAQLGTFGAVPKLINEAVELVAKIIEKGGSVADAIGEAVQHIRKNHSGYFDESGFRKFAEDKIKPVVKESANAVSSPSVSENPTSIPDKKAPLKTVKLEEGERLRSLSDRATRAESVPEPVQEKIAQSTESKYRQQKGDEVDAQVQAMSPSERAALTPDSDLYVASQLKTASDLFRDGKNDAGYKLMQKLAKEGTHMGQLINQFKRLTSTTPEMVASVLDTALKDAGKDGLTKDQTAKVVDLAAKSKAKDVELNRATDEWKDNPTPENAAKADAAHTAANDAAVDLQKFNARFTPRSWGGLMKTILQGNLISPMSHAANLIGNMSFMPGRIPSRAVRSGIDIIDHYLTGRAREFSADPISGTVEAAKGLVRGAKKIPSILAKGSGDVIKGETRAGLHPIEAWKNQFAKAPEMPTTGGKLTINDRIKLLVEGTLGAPAESMLRLLGAGDAPFSSAARGRATAEQLRLNKVPRSQWDFAQKFPELFLDKESLKRIQSETNDAVFQTESKALNAATRWMASLGPAADFAISTVAPYKLTPFNIVKEIVRFNPVVAFLRGSIAAIKGDSKTAKAAAGDMVAGTVMVGAATWLYQKGLIAPSLDAKDEAQKARLASASVMPPNHINISGLKRALAGGDPKFKPGDETKDFFRAGGLAGSAMYMVANVGRDIEKGKDDGTSMALNILRQSTLEQARFGLNQSFLQGVEGLLSAVKDGNTDQYLKSWFSTVLSIPLPNTLGAASRATREFKPELTDKKSLGKSLENIIRNRVGVFGADDKLPPKRDFWGEPIRETPKGDNPYLYNFLDVTKGQQVTDDPVNLEIYELWRKTANSDAIPSLVGGSATKGGKDFPLNNEQKSRLQELVGKERRMIVEAMVENPNFQKRDDEQKIETLNRAYRRGLSRGKRLFFREYPNLEADMKRTGFDFSE